VAFSILQDLYKDTSGSSSTSGSSNSSVQNPFLPILLAAFEQAGAGQQHPALFAERLFVAELLINPQATREVNFVFLSCFWGAPVM
jgi:hypothetical protein